MKLYTVEHKGVLIAEFTNKKKAEKGLRHLVDYFPDGSLCVDWD